MSNILRISDAASLALHTMVMLAAKDERPISAKEMARALGASEAHLAKVLQRLVRVGMVRSERGPHGGFVLGRNGARVSLLEVFQAIDGPMGKSSCLLDSAVCGGKRCILGGMVRKVHDEVRGYLANTKLSDLAPVFRNLFEGKNHETQDCTD